MKRLLVVSFAFVLFAVMAVLSYGQDPVPGTWLYDQNENKIDDRIETIAATFPDSLIGMIVDFRHRPINEEDELFLQNFGDVDYIMQYIPSISMSHVQAEVAFSIAENIEVVMVELDEIVRITLDTSARAIRARSSTLYPNSAWSAGFDGQGQIIAILDTGVDDDHPSLDDMDDNTGTNDPKFVAGYDATASPRVATNPDDDNTHYWNGSKYVQGDIFHGTHVAGIALGTGGGTDTAGVAPDAKLVDVKVLDYRGEGKLSDVIAGVEWCITNRNTAWAGQSSDYQGIDVLNMSLAGSSSSDGQDALCRVVNKAVDMGLVVVCAAGNDNKTNHIPTPSAADKAITVGSVNDQGTINRADDTISSHTSWGTNRGPRKSDGDGDQMDELKPDVTAYGSFIHSAKGVDPGQNGSDYHEISGTSMATPHAAGVCALILEAHSQFQPHDVKNLLRDTAEDKDGTYNASLDPDYDVDFGWGIVDAQAAVTTPAGPPDLWISRQPRWWYSKDIWLDSPPVVGLANRVNARIRNTSGTAAGGVTVRFQVGIFGTGQPHFKWVWTQSDTISLPATGNQTSSVAWTPTANLLVTGPGHPCIRVEIIYAQDPNTSNNMAQKNIKIDAALANVFTFRAWNRFDAHKNAFFGLDRLDLPEGWNAYFAPDGVFEMDYGDSTDIFGEVFPSPHAMVGDTGTIHVSQFFQGTIVPTGGLTVSLVVGAAPAKIVLPEASGVFRDTLLIPIPVSTDSSIGIAQFVIDYNNDVVELIETQVGPDASGFSLLTNIDLPFPPSTAPETNRNVLVQINGGGSRFFSGQNQEVVLLRFVIVDSILEHMTPLIFDRDPERTFLTTDHFHEIRGEELAIFDGSIWIRETFWPITVMVRYDLIDPPIPVSGVDVTLMNEDGVTILEDTTGVDGFCHFPEVPAGNISFTLAKWKNFCHDAVTGSDALVTLRYLAFLEELSEPQMIAADVTREGDITGSDALAILRFLAFFDTDIGHTGSWDFVTGTPVPVPTPLPGPDEVIEFSGYYLGDVNLNCGSERNISSVRGQVNADILKQTDVSNVSMNLGRVKHISKGEVLVPVNIQIHKQPVNTMVFSVEYDPECLTYLATTKTELTEHFMMVSNGIEAGTIHIAMAGVPGILKNGDVLQLAFKVVENTPKDHAKLDIFRAFINDLAVENMDSGYISLDRSDRVVPKTYKLIQNYPNPFNAETTIRYTIPYTECQPVHVRLYIYNINGQLVRSLVNKKNVAGYHSVTWDGQDNGHRPVASGIYFYRIQTSGFRSMKKMVVLK